MDKNKPKNKDKNMQTENTLAPEIQTKNKEIISFFDKDVDFVFVYKKTEKLATAVYLITNLFSDNEPMKWTLRKKVGDVLFFVLGYKDIVLSNHKVFSDNLKTKILELISMLEISSRSGLVSFMNYSVLEQEFLALIEKIDSIPNSNKESIQNNLSQSFFYVPATQKTFPSTHLGTEKSEQSLSDSSTRNITDIHKDKFVTKKTNRQESIINILKKKGDLTIKDISQVIRDCSEKTIQRELISLIAMNIVKKTGERRWSKYSLI